MTSLLLPSSNLGSNFLPGHDMPAFDSPFQIDALDSYIELESPPMSRPGSPPNNASFGASFMPADLFRELMGSECLPENQLKPVDSSFIPLDTMKDTLYTPPQSPTRSPTQCRAPKATESDPASGFESFSFTDMDLLMLNDSEISDALLRDDFGIHAVAPHAVPQVEQSPAKSKDSKGGAKRTKPVPATKKVQKKKPSPLVKSSISAAALLKGPIDLSKIDKKTQAAIKRAKASEAASEAVREAQAMSSEDPRARRLTHNVLERKRRNDLKNSYQELRECIPEVEDNERTPTGQILIKAMEHVTHLKEREVNMLERIAEARRENERLRQIIAEHGHEAVVPALPVPMSA